MIIKKFFNYLIIIINIAKNEQAFKIAQWGLKMKPLKIFNMSLESNR